MKAQELSKKYAGAVFSLALEQWLTALSAVQEKLRDNTALAQGLADADRSFADRQKELDGVIPADSDSNIRNFLYTLLKNGDIGLLGDVLVDLGQMSRGGPQVEVAEITTAVALSDDEKEQFRQKLLRSPIWRRAWNLSLTLTQAIVGGAIVQIGDKVIDGSVSDSRLEIDE